MRADDLRGANWRVGRPSEEEVEQSVMVSGVQRLRVDRDASDGSREASALRRPGLCEPLVSDLGGCAHDGRRRHRLAEAYMTP